MAVKENLEAIAVKTGLNYLNKNPEKNLPKLLDWFDRFDRKGTLSKQREAIRKVVEDEENNWYKLIMSLCKEIDPGVRDRLFENLIINGCLLGYQRQKEDKEKDRIKGPSMSGHTDIHKPQIAAAITKKYKRAKYL